MRTSDGQKYTIGEDLMHTAKNAGYGATKSVIGWTAGFLALGTVVKIGIAAYKPMVDVLLEAGKQEAMPNTLEEFAYTAGAGIAGALFGRFVFPAMYNAATKTRGHHQGGMAESAENTERRGAFRDINNKVAIAKREAKANEKIAGYSNQATTAV